jgi:thymidine kinase
MSITHFDNSYGHLELILSCMFAGKSSSLINKLNLFSLMGVRCLYVNHALDTRGDAFSTHNPTLTCIGNISSIKAETLREIDFDEYDVIGIDEAGFFPDLTHVVLELVEKHQKRVIVAGLTGDYQRRPLGQTLDLIPYADAVTKLSAVCKRCAEKRMMREASFSHRVQPSTSQIEVGFGYVPLCRSCYLEATREETLKETRSQEEPQETLGKTTPRSDQ